MQRNATHTLHQAQDRTEEPGAINEFISNRFSLDYLDMQ